MKLRNIGLSVLISAFVQSAFAQSFENAIYVKMEKFNRMTSSANRILSEGKDLLSVEKAVQVEKVMVGDWVKVTMPGARSAEDLLAASRRLKSIPGVAAVDLPRKKKLFALTPSSFNDPGWASQLINFSGNGSSATRANLRVSPQFDLVLEKYATRSNELIMAVIDSGLNPSPDFEGRILSQRDYFERTNFIPSNDASPNGESCEFDPGLHGSHVASVMGAAANNNYGALGLAPNAKFHVARIFNCNGGFSFSGYLDELERLSLLEEDRPSVVNLSFGDVPSFTGAYPACSSIEQDAITLAVEAGIIVVASSGNDGSFANGRSLPAPASCDGVVSVGAVDNGGKYTSYSTVAPQLDIATFGGGTSDNRSFEAVNVTDPFENNNFALGTTQGTSFSSPAVATILAYARLLDPTIDTPTAVNMMQSTAYRATNETDSRCAGTNCYSLKAANFLAMVEGVDLPGPVSDLPGDPNPNPNPEPNPEPEPNPNPEPNPEPEPEPTPEPEVPEQPVTGRVTVQVEAGNFAGGFEDICDIVITENDEISVLVNGTSDRCGQAAQRTRSPFANQTVSVTGPVGAIFSAQVVGFKPNESNQSVLVSRLQLNQNSVTPVVAESQEGAPAASGGGGGGSMSIYGLLGIALLMTAFRRKVNRV